MSTQTDVIEEVQEETEIQEPSMFRVIIHNDDKTTFDFVIYVLTTIFDKEYNEAAELTFRVHDSGSATAGIYTFQIAETKVEEATEIARLNNYPLTLTLEEF
jgi:ATP-dependent Clp protease adaptor protein ClpS